MPTALHESGGAETSARGEKDGESEGPAGGGERSAGQRLLGEASSEGGADGLPGADRENQPCVRLAGAARGCEGVGARGAEQAGDIRAAQYRAVGDARYWGRGAVRDNGCLLGG